MFQGVDNLNKVFVPEILRSGVVFLRHEDCMLLITVSEEKIPGAWRMLLECEKRATMIYK